MFYLAMTLAALCAVPGLRSVGYAVRVSPADSYSVQVVIPRKECEQPEPGASPKPKKHKRAPIAQR
jgi:hypothetical protein